MFPPVSSSFDIYENLFLLFIKVAALDRMDPDAAAAIGLLPQFGSALPFDAPLQIRHAVTGLYVRC